MSLHHFSPTADPAEVSACVGEHGYAIVDDFLSHATAVQLLLTQIITIGPGETLTFGPKAFATPG